jgi:hypothetical protein
MPLPPTQLRQLIEGGCHLTPRMRLSCRIIRARRRRRSSTVSLASARASRTTRPSLVTARHGPPMQKPDAGQGNAASTAASATADNTAGGAMGDDTAGGSLPGDISICACEPEWLSLNEVVIDRGNATFLGMLDIYVDEQLVTTAQVRGSLARRARLAQEG